MQYEIMNKVTGVCTPVTGMTFGEDYVTAETLELGEVTFSNIGQVGDLQNEEYSIREVGTHIEADGTGTVEFVAQSETGALPVENVVDVPTE